MFLDYYSPPSRSAAVADRCFFAFCMCGWLCAFFAFVLLGIVEWYWVLLIVGLLNTAVVMTGLAMRSRYAGQSKRSVSECIILTVGMSSIVLGVNLLWRFGQS
jgi:hypothetical protein